MKKLLDRNLVALGLMLGVWGCTGPSVHLHGIRNAAELPANCQPHLVDLGEAVPSDALLLGEAGYGDTGFSIRCGRRRIHERLRMQACRCGADVVRIVKENEANVVSTCYRVRAEFYKLGATPVGHPERVIEAHLEYGEKLTGFPPATPAP
jgi:hypothetical protein